MKDLKKDFFSLSQLNLRRLLKLYGEKYGDSAADYALKRYPDWKNGTVRMSAQTLSRLIQNLPYFLTPQQKVSLANKLLEFYYKKYWDSTHTYIHSYRVHMTWEDFDAKISQTILTIQQYPWGSDDQNNWEKIIPQNVQELAAWIYDDDSMMIKQIIDDFMRRKKLLAISNSINDLEKFRQHCRTLLVQGYIYEDLRFDIKLPDIRIFITVQHAKKVYCNELRTGFRGDSYG